jgi:O-antigen/teichoic acid export membrane protein
MMASQVTVQLLAFITSLVIARLLGPREVGLAAMALVFSSLALILVDAGLPSVIVQRPQLTERDKSTAFWTGMALGVLLTLIGVALSWPLASLYGEPKVQPLFAVLSLTLLFTAPGVIQGALLNRELSFRKLEVRTMIATAASSAAAISLAAIGVGAWAIIAQHLIISGLSSALLWRAAEWRPSFTFSIESLRGMAAYASHVFGSQLVSWATVNVDNLLVGRFLGAHSLGAYSLAYSIIVTPVNRLAEPVAHVFFPAFSRMQDPARIAPAWMRGSRMIALAVIPAMLGLIAVAPDLVHVLFGTRWEESIPVIEILASAGMLQALMGLNWGVLQALDRARAAFRFSIAEAVLTVSAFAAGLPWGLKGVATAYLAAAIITQPVLLGLTSRVLGVSPWTWLRAVSRVALAGIAMFAIVALVREALLATELATALRLLATTAVGGLAYAALIYWWVPEVRADVRELKKRIQERSPEPPTEDGLETTPPYDPPVL